MKNRLSILLASSLMLVFFSCKKEENKIYYEGGTPPVLTASTNAVTLEPGLENNTAIAFSWTNPDYMFTTGVSSHDVTYTLEIDTAGAGFGSGVKYQMVISNELSKTFTVAELNDILGNTMLLQLEPRRSYTFQARVISSIGSKVQLVSNAAQFTATPFSPPPKVEPPGTKAANYDDGELWMIGDAAPGKWDNPIPAPYADPQKFSRISTTLYELTIDLPGGGGYKLIQEQGVWGSQYHMVTGTWEGGTFEKRDSDPQFPGPPTVGKYKITVDFQTGKYNVVKLQ